MRNLLVISLLAGFAFGSTALVPSGRALGGDAAATTRPAPAFTFPDIEGRPVKLTDFKGRPLLVLFWASWDDHSREQISVLMSLRQDWTNPPPAQVPFFLQLQKESTNLDWQVIGVALDGFATGDPLKKGAQPKDLKTWADSQKLNFPILLADRKLIEDFGGLDGIPTILVIDQHLNIVVRHTGVVERSVLENDLRKIEGK